MPKSYDDLLAERINWRRADKRSVELLAEEDSEKVYYDPPEPALTDFLKEDDNTTPWRIEGLHHIGDNCTITAKYKTGKSTLMLNLITSLADGRPFLGEFAVTPPEGNISVWNMELSASLFRDWCRDLRIENTHKVRVTNLRGRRQALYSKLTQDRVVERMKRNEVECWIIDPGARILAGWPGNPDPENSNACVTEATEILDEIKERAGIKDLWIPLHTGRGGENRSRGATRWDDWTDQRLMLYIDGKLSPGELLRVLESAGRDSLIFERPLSYDEANRALRIEESLDGMRASGAARAVVFALAEHPEGLAGKMLNDAIKGVPGAEKMDAIALAERRGWILRKDEGRTKLAVLNHANPEVKDLLFSGPGAI